VCVRVGLVMIMTSLSFQPAARTIINRPAPPCRLRGVVCGSLLECARDRLFCGMRCWFCCTSVNWLTMRAVDTEVTASLAQCLWLRLRQVQSHFTPEYGARVAGGGRACDQQRWRWRVAAAVHCGGARLRRRGGQHHVRILICTACCVPRCPRCRWHDSVYRTISVSGGVIDISVSVNSVVIIIAIISSGGGSSSTARSATATAGRLCAGSRRARGQRGRRR
jgi:hypothetical protein